MNANHHVPSELLPVIAAHVDSLAELLSLGLVCKRFYTHTLKTLYDPKSDKVKKFLRRFLKEQWVLSAGGATRFYLLPSGSPQGESIVMRCNSKQQYDEFREALKLPPVDSMEAHPTDGVVPPHQLKLVRTLHRNGMVRKRAQYWLGKKNGREETYDRDGALEELSTWKAGKLDGVREGYDKDRRCVKSVMYKDGHIDFVAANNGPQEPRKPPSGNNRETAFFISSPNVALKPAIEQGTNNQEGYTTKAETKSPNLQALGTEYCVTFALYDKYLDTQIWVSHGIVLVYSVINRASFEAIPRLWERVCFLRGTKNVPLVLVGIDLEKPDRVVSSKEGEEQAKAMDSAFIECQTATLPNTCRNILTLLIETVEKKVAEKNGLTSPTTSSASTAPTPTAKKSQEACILS